MVEAAHLTIMAAHSEMAEIALHLGILCEIPAAHFGERR